MSEAASSTFPAWPNISSNTGGNTVFNYDNTIEGDGAIGANLVIDNGALGTVNANDSSLLTIQAQQLSNEGAIETTGSGGLTIVGAGDDIADSNIDNEGALIAGGSGC